MPLEMRLATSRLRLITAGKSTSIVPALRPNSLARWNRSSTSAVRKSALVGMQPQLRQMPPSSAFSTQATRSPSCAARMAAT